MSIRENLKIIFAGTSDFAVPVLEKLLHSAHRIVAVYTQPDRPAGRGLHLQTSPVKNYALACHLNIEQPMTLRDEISSQKLREFQPDVMVVVSYGLLLPKEILSIPKYGCLNIHPSLLPRWRGATPLQSAILAGDPQTGISIFQMNERMDAGDILLRQECTLDPKITCGELSQKLSVWSGELLLTLLSDLGEGKLTPQPQVETQAIYCRKIMKEDTLIKWEESALQIDRKVRAYNPIPTAYAFLDKERIKIWYTSVNEETHQGVPGQIIEQYEDAIVVATGQGVLKILELQLAGGKRLTVKEILRSRSRLFAKGRQFTEQL